MNKEQRARLLRKIRAAVSAVCRVDNTDLPAWPAYLKAVEAGVDSLANEIPPTGWPALPLQEDQRDIWGELIITASMPTSLFVSHLPYQQKLGFAELGRAYPGLDISLLQEPLDLINYWHHSIMHGGSLQGSLLEIVHEDRFLSSAIRKGIQHLYEADRNSCLSIDSLNLATDGQSILIVKALRSAYLCLSRPTPEGFLGEAEQRGFGAFEVATALAMQAITCCNQLDEFDDDLSGALAEKLTKVEAGAVAHWWLPLGMREA